MVGCKKVGGAVVCGVVHHGSRTGRKATAYNQGYRLVFHLPIVTFWTVDVDVARSAVPEGAIRRVFSNEFSFSAQEGTITLDHLSYGNFPSIFKSQGLSVF